MILGFAGEIYQTPRINVNIVHAQCSDGMSDRTYPDKVQVTVDGRRFNGCGGRKPPCWASAQGREHNASLRRQRWHVTASIARR